MSLATGSCVGGSRGAGSSLKAEAITGAVEIRENLTSPWRALKTGDRVKPGGDVRTGDGASVALARDDGDRIELGPKTQVRLNGVTRVALETGRLLAVVESNPLAVFSDQLEVSAGRAVFRLDREFAVRVGVYLGTVDVAADGSRVSVPPLRQIEVAGGILPRDAKPLRASATDPWDARILSEALDLDRQLRSYGRAFNADFAAQARDPEFYAGLASGISPAIFSTALANAADPADVLFGLLMAQKLRGQTTTLFLSLMQLRLAGASWGLIARERRVVSKDLIAAVAAVLVPAGPTPPPGTPPGSPRPSPKPTRTSSPSPSPTSSPSPSSSASPSPSPSPCTPIDQLLGNCDGALPPP